jgi:murein L,D-transpeptidase YafK
MSGHRGAQLSHIDRGFIAAGALRARWLAGALALTFLLGSPAAAGGGWPTPKDPPDKVRVVKSKRTLEVWKDGVVIRSFRVSLGSNPLGHKRMEGDGRTPEGNYILDWRKEDSVAHRAIHISYPDEADREWARENGWKPGGAIMIHGQWNGFGWFAWLLQNFDWTNGCIGLDNADMDELWNMLAWSTPIEIVP